MIAAESRPWATVQRVRWPDAGDTSMLSLYIDRTRSVGAVPSGQTLAIERGGRASFASYFGALPLGTWVAHTGERTFRLEVRATGDATVVVYVSDSSGVSRVTDRVPLAAGTASIDVVAPADAGWAWFELRPDGDECVLTDARWLAPAPDVPATGGICVTTLDREADCLGVLRKLSDDPELLDRLSSIVVVDQGRRRLRDADGFSSVADRLGDRLRVIVQPNLGGSGGFSRGMLEVLDVATHAILLDDDVEIETDSILRMLSFAERARGDVIVGGQMLSIVDRSLLHTVGERIDRRGFWWIPVDDSLAPVDLAQHPLEDTPALHRTHRVDFNGWWLCAIPTDLIRRDGASLPLFIKWDDAEYGLRAGAHGVRTVTLPGAALWHMPWTAKDDGLDWQAYFQLRGRMVTALAHGRLRRGVRVLLATLAQDLNHILCGQYGSVALRIVAFRDVLAGPSHFEPVLRAGPGRAAEVLRRYAQVVVPREDLPSVQALADRPLEQPRGLPSTLWRAARVLAHQLRSPRPTPSTVQARLPRSEGKWWRLGVLDAATVDSASGTGAFVVRRDRRRALRLTASAIALRCRMWLAWPRLADEYRRSVPEVASVSAWGKRFSSSEAPSS